MTKKKNVSANSSRWPEKNEAIIGSRAVLHSTPEQKEYSTTLKSLYTKKKSFLWCCTIELLHPIRKYESYDPKLYCCQDN